MAQSQVKGRNGSEPKRRRWRLARIAHARRKLIGALLLGATVAVMVPGTWPVVTRLLFGWNVTTLAYLAVAYWRMSQADVAGIRRRARVEDEGGIAILAVTAVAAGASLAAILIELKGAKGSPIAMLPMALATTTVFLSWAFIHTIFALHYAHEFYGEGRDGHEGGLDFPGKAEPTYADFLYFSFVIGMTFQVSDVAVTSRLIRRIVLAQSIVSFVYNTALLALSVNIAASFV